MRSNYLIIVILSGSSMLYSAAPGVVFEQEGQRATPKSFHMPSSQASSDSGKPDETLAEVNFDGLANITSEAKKADHERKISAKQPNDTSVMQALDTVNGPPTGSQEEAEKRIADLMIKDAVDRQRLIRKYMPHLIPKRPTPEQTDQPE